MKLKACYGVGYGSIVGEVTGGRGVCVSVGVAVEKAVKVYVGIVGGGKVKVGVSVDNGV